MKSFSLFPKLYLAKKREHPFIRVKNTTHIVRVVHERHERHFSPSVVGYIMAPPRRFIPSELIPGRCSDDGRERSSSLCFVDARVEALRLDPRSRVARFRAP